MSLRHLIPYYDEIEDRELAADSSTTTTTPCRFWTRRHECTRGRYLFNEKQRLRERHIDFNVQELARTACGVVKKPRNELVAIEKLAEGGFNRMLQVRSSDEEILVRLPFRLEAPLPCSMASEAATVSFLWQGGLPVPKILGVSVTAVNPVGIEYILLEKLPERPLGEHWFSLDNRIHREGHETDRRSREEAYLHRAASFGKPLLRERPSKR
ncbi:hypothetical protein AC579_407 [Pseudocercospora musae]|uniref:Aminoglycoside phosphotransferase domain-containing protein n=1 Tax=Pseudocercospora musae TaxID=113226 RepID=A0A139GY85_9PEZI|nr:hypothetical protein AC579_407 [Pseudocercospora musae]KXS95162.1 hypothetical protein AC579_407 [Pseudocercospora musae]KXS95163.1 hypothetical protein AC579_407 [Pseudocercospora musae]